MTESEKESSDSTFKMGISIWLSVCVFACLWFLSRFMKGRTQLRSNLHIIEDGLRRMQEDIEQRQRENSMGYGENLEELLEELQKENIIKKIHNLEMRNQKVGVDVWKMVFSSCSYLGLACAAWVLIKLVCACFWLPKYLQAENHREEQKNSSNPGGKEDLEEIKQEGQELLAQDKKND